MPYPVNKDRKYTFKLFIYLYIISIFMVSNVHLFNFDGSIVVFLTTLGESCALR